MLYRISSNPQMKIQRLNASLRTRRRSQISLELNHVLPHTRVHLTHLTILFNNILRHVLITKANLRRNRRPLIVEQTHLIIHVHGREGAIWRRLVWSLKRRRYRLVMACEVIADAGSSSLKLKPLLFQPLLLVSVLVTTQGLRICKLFATVLALESFRFKRRRVVRWRADAIRCRDFLRAITADEFEAEQF